MCFDLFLLRLSLYNKCKAIEESARYNKNYSACVNRRGTAVLKRGVKKTRTEVNLFSFLKLHTFDQTEKYGEERSTEEKREFQMFQNLAQKQFLLYKLIESTDVIVGFIHYVRCTHMLHLGGSMVMVCFVQPTAPWWRFFT